MKYFYTLLTSFYLVIFGAFIKDIDVINSTKEELLTYVTYVEKSIINDESIYNYISRDIVFNSSKVSEIEVRYTLSKKVNLSFKKSKRIEFNGIYIIK